MDKSLKLRCFIKTPYTDGWFVFSENEFVTFIIMVRDYSDITKVEQYTGCKDKKGNPIYVGDILKGENAYFIVKYGSYHISETIATDIPIKGQLHTFHNNHAGFYVEYTEYDIHYEDSLIPYNQNTEIVGNVNQNPELLKHFKL